MTWPMTLVALWCGAFVLWLAVRLTCEEVRAVWRRRRFRRHLAALQVEADELLAAASLARMVEGET